MIGEIVPRLIAFVLLPIYTNYLSAADYGVVSYTNAVVMFLFFVAILSMNSYALRFYFEYKSEEERKRMLGNVFLFIGAVNLLILIISWIIAPWLIARYELQVPWDPYMKLALVNNFLEVFSVIPLVLYRVRQQALKFVALNLGRIILQFVLTYIFIVVMDWGVIGHYYGRLFSLIPFFLIFWIVMWRNVTFNINWPQIWQGLKYALPLMPGAVAYFALSFSDRIILERNVDMALIGIYNIAYTLSFALTVLNQGVYKAIEPEVFKRWGRGDFRVFMDKSQNIFFLLLYSGAIALALFAQEIFMMMASDSYMEGYRYVPIIVIGVIMTGQNVIYNSLLSAEKNTKAIGLATIVGAIVSLVFNISMIPMWGVWAACMGMAVSFMVMNVLMFIFMKYKGKNLLPAIAALALYVVVTFGVTYWIDLPFSPLNILIKIIIFVCSVAVLHFVVFRTCRYINLSKLTTR